MIKIIPRSLPIRILGYKGKIVDLKKKILQLFPNLDPKIFDEPGFFNNFRRTLNLRICTLREMDYLYRAPHSTIKGLIEGFQLKGCLRDVPIRLALWLVENRDEIDHRYKTPWRIYKVRTDMSWKIRPSLPSNTIETICSRASHEPPNFYVDELIVFEVKK